MTQQEFFNRYIYKPSTDKLGGGSFGKVYKAYDTVLDKYIAIKVAEQIEVSGKIFSLLDEFKALDSLPDHVNIAKYEQLYTYESPQGMFDYAIMQYYADGNLSQLIHEQKLNENQKENLALQLLNGIDFLHQNKVVHRDLKPSNILIHNRVLNNNKEYIPKITDFGLSKKANTDKNTHFTNSFAAGTYAYSSPEQLRGEILRFNTDLWAYGAIVYEIFTGKTMFNIVNKKTGSSALDIKDILELIINSDIAPKIKELPIKWQNVVTACLVRNAQNRVKTAQEVYAILNNKNQAPTFKEEKTKVLPSPTIDKTQFETTHPNSAANNNKPQTKSYKPYFIGIGIVLLGITTFILWPKKQTEKPIQNSIVETDSIKKVDTLANTPIITETDWKKDFETKFATLKATEKQNTAEVNIKQYKELLASLPSEAKNEKQKLKTIIEELTNSKSSSTLYEKVDPNWKNKYEYYGGFTEGLGYVTIKGGKKGFVDKNGKIVIPAIYDDMGFFSEGLAAVGINNKHGYIDKKGKIVVPLIYDYTFSFKEGLGGVMLNSKNGFIDKKGNVIIPIIYDWFYRGFSNGIVQVKLEATSPAFFINKKGECVKDCP